MTPGRSRHPDGAPGGDPHGRGLPSADAPPADAPRPVASRRRRVPDPFADDGPDEPPRRHRAAAAGPLAAAWRRIARLYSPGVAILVLAVAAAGLLLLGPRLRQPQTGAPVPLATAWPAATLGTLPANLPDGPAYDPAYLLDDGASVGTAPTPDGLAQRLVLVRGGATRTLRALPVGTDPLFGGVTAHGDALFWAETTTGPGGSATSSLWSADWRAGTPARRLTTQTGALAFFHSAYDLQPVGDRLHWVAVGAGATPVTELRSMPLGGGRVGVRALPGQWTQTRWPWLVSAASVASGRSQRYHLDTNQVQDVPTAATELTQCGAQWCRVQVLGAAGPTQLDLMRPDGGDRRRVAGAGVSAALTDVAVLDRFEVLTRLGGGGAPSPGASPAPAVANGQELLLYDIARRRVVVAAQNVNVVNSRAGRLWWSTGSVDNTRWHTLDLRTLA